MVPLASEPPALEDRACLTSRGRALLIAITLLGAAVRIAFQVGRPFVGDEVGSLAFLNESYATLVTTFRGQLTMNYYLVLLKAIRGVFGNSAWALVVPSLLAGVGTIVLTARLVRCVASEQVALIAALLTAFNPTLIFYSVRIRSYMLFVVFALAAILAFYRWMERHSWRAGTLCALCSTLALLAHANAVYQMGFLGVLFALDVIRRRTVGWSFVVPMAVAAAVVILAYLPLQADMAEFRAMWSDTPPTSWAFLPEMLATFFDGGWALALTLALAARGLWTATRDNRRLAELGLGILVPLVLLSLLGVSHYPWTYARFLLPLLPLVIAFVAQGIADVSFGSPRAAGVAALIVVASWSPALVESYVDRHDRPYAEIADFLMEERIGTAELFAVERTTRRHLTPYLPSEIFASVDDLLIPSQPTRLFVVGAVPISSSVDDARFGEMQVLTYAGASSPELSLQLLADLRATLGGRVDAELADHYGFVMDLLFRLGEEAELAKVSALYYECQMRTRRQRGTPPQLFERSTSSRHEDL